MKLEMVALMRRTLLYSWLSYRALFSWANPRLYVATLVILPVSVGALFVIVSNAAHADATRPILGSALLATNNAVMYGTALVIMNERWQGTMELWLAAPQSLARSILAKSLVHLGNGLVTAALTLLCVGIMFGVRHDAAVLWRLLLCVVAVSVSAVGIGIVTASFGILSREAIAAPNAMRSLILIGSGAVVDTSVLALNLDLVGHVLPVRHAVEAALQVVRGQGVDVRLLIAEVLVGGGWALVGLVILRYVLVFARRRARFYLD